MQTKSRRQILLESKVRQQKKTIQKLEKTLKRIITVAEKARHEEYGRQMLEGIEQIRWIAKEATEGIEPCQTNQKKSK